MSSRDEMILEDTSRQIAAARQHLGDHQTYRLRVLFDMIHSELESLKRNAVEGLRSDSRDDA